MPEYRGSTVIDTNPDELFQFLSEIENLPKYFHRLKEAHSATGDEVIVTADVPEAAQPGEDDVKAYANFSIDADHRALSWSSAGEHNYGGTLEVTPESAGSKLSVTLHTEHESDGIQNGIEETLANVRELVAQRKV
jgi:hypothetical protein